MSLRARGTAWSVLLLSGLPFHTLAEGLALPPGVSASIRSDAWSGSRHLDNVKGVAQASLWTNGKVDMADAGALTFNGWFRGQTKSPTEPRDALSPRTRVRELYWRQTMGDVQFKIGRLMEAWGRADGVNPTDKLSARDTTLLTPSDADQRHGNEAMQVSIDSEAGRFSWTWFAHATSDLIPLSVQPGLHYRIEQPARKPQWALKWDINGAGADGSVSYFDGADPNPSIRLDAAGSDSIQVGLFNQHMRMLGADFSANQGEMVWRGELAATQSPQTATSPYFNTKSQVFGVLGGEYSGLPSSTVSAQLIAKRVSHYQDPDELPNPVARQVAWSQAANRGQTAAFQKGLTLRLAKRVLNDTLNMELSGVALWPSKNGLWRGRLDYSLNDHWTLLAGTDAFFGTRQTSFGQLKANRLWYVQAKYGV